MATIPGFELFNGATMSRIVDGAGVVWRGCCTQRAGNKASFGFYIFKNGVEVPYTPFCTARGQVTKDGWWTAWEGAQYFEGALPGFTPIPAGDTSALEAEIDALTARVDALTAQLAGSPPVISGGVLYLSGQPGMPVEGGELQLVDGAGGMWAIDCRDGNLRFIHNGVVYKRWPE